MSLLRTIMEHSTLSLSGGNNSSSVSNSSANCSNHGNNTTNSVTTTTMVSNPTITSSATATSGDVAISPTPQTSTNTISNNGPTISAELIAIRNSKEQQRRRERRERRIRRQRRGANGLLPMPTPEQLQHYYHHNLAYGGGTFDPYSINAIYGSNGEYGFNCNPAGINMPDILNSHVPSGSTQPPPPYSTLPGSGQRASVSSRMPQSVVHRPPHVASPSRGPRGWRHAIFPANRTTNDRRSQPLFLGGGYEDETGGGGAGRLDKSCCGVTVTQTVSIRWFIVMIAFVGICCSVVGTVLGAMKASGREHLTVSLLMIGVGIVLITVSGIAWRLTSTDAPSCRAMLGLGGGIDGDDCNGRFLTRPNAMAAAAAAVNYGRPQHPYAAMMYSDFNYRPPPPSYQASMQEYRLRLLLLDRGHPNHNTLNGSSSTAVENTRTISGTNDRAQQQMLQQQSNGAIHPPAISQPQTHGQNSGIGNLSPPPAYRSHLRTAMANAIVHSRPPSYRSHQSDHEIIVPQTNSSNGINNQTTSQREQASTSSGPSQILSTTAQINHEVENSHDQHISNQNTSSNSNHEMPSKLSDTSLGKCRETSDSLLVSNPDQPSFQPEEFSQSTSHLQNISSVACLTGAPTLSQQHEAYEPSKQECKTVNVAVSMPSFSNNTTSVASTSEQKGEKHKIRDKTLVPSHLDEAFEVTHSAAELMKNYNFQTSSTDVWQLLPTAGGVNVLENPKQPKSLPATHQTSHYLSPTHIQQFNYPSTSTTGRRSSAGRKIVSLFSSNRAGDGVTENSVVNVSMDSSSNLSNTSSATSSYSPLTSSKRGKKNKDKKENSHNNHSSLVTIIHHQKSSSDYEESDCEQSSFAYSRLGSDRDGYEGESHQNSDIVTVTSSLSRRHKDDNYQILSVSGMHTMHLEAQNSTNPEKNLSDSKKNDGVEQPKMTPSGQQVEFLAHL